MCVPTNPYKIVKEFTHEGLQCAVTLTAPYHHHCGYVRVPPGHALHGVSSWAFHCDATVNFAEPEPCQEHPDGIGWWFGFDCAHCFDLSIDPMAPEDQLTEVDLITRKFEQHDWGMPRHYWTADEVEQQVRTLAEQVAALA